MTFMRVASPIREMTQFTFHKSAIWRKLILQTFKNTISQKLQKDKNLILSNSIDSFQWKLGNKFGLLNNFKGLTALLSSKVQGLIGLIFLTVQVSGI